MKVKILLLGYIITLASFVCAQNKKEKLDTVPIKKESKKIERLRGYENRLGASIRSGDSQKEMEEYLSLSRDYFKNLEFQKSLQYAQKAQNIAANTQYSAKKTEAYRLIAMNQEKLHQKSAAAKNYKLAAESSKNQKDYLLNFNDYNRLNIQEPVVQQNMLEDNIALNQDLGRVEEVAVGYEQLGELELEAANVPEAVSNFEQAYELSKENNSPKQSKAINQKLAEVLVDNNRVDEAVEVKSAVLKEDFVQQDKNSLAEETRNLAKIVALKDKNQAEKLLKEAYEIALESGLTLQATGSLGALDSLYLEQNQPQKSLAAYRQFIQQLPELINQDSTLADNRVLEEIELRVQNLENERQLQDEILYRRKIWNYGLFAGLGLMVVLMVVIFINLKRLSQKNKKIALQSLRREMNPHFIFNSLNAVNQYIAGQNPLEANSFLTKFSKLMRRVLDQSSKDFIPLNEEVEWLKNYLDLEQSRFPDKFAYEMTVSDELPPHVQMPTMLVQPFLENSVWHGLRYLDKPGKLILDIQPKNSRIYVTIQDNGIGIKKSEELKTANQRKRNGRGLKNIYERIALLNSLYKKDIDISVNELKEGVQVLLSFKTSSL